MLYIVIPYRDRQLQLIRYLEHILPLLRSCISDFRIVFIEQGNSKPFNKGLLLNAAIKCLKLGDEDEIIFHDIEILPEHDIVLECYKPKIKANYVLGIYTDKDSMDGVFKINKADFDKINGFPTNYWGWGFEGDTIRERLNMANTTIVVKYSPNTISAAANFIVPEKEASISRDKRLNGERNEAMHRHFCQCSQERKIQIIEKSGLNTTHFTLMRHLYIESNPFVEFITVDI